MKSSRFSRSQNQSFKRSLFRLRKDRAPCCAFMAQERRVATFMSSSMPSPSSSGIIDRRTGKPDFAPTGLRSRDESPTGLWQSPRHPLSPSTGLTSILALAHAHFSNQAQKSPNSKDPSSIALAAPPPRLALHHLLLLLAQRDPGPQPADHLDEYEGEEDAVLEEVAAPRGGCVRGAPAVGGGRGGPAAGGGVGAVEGRGGAEEEGVEQEEEGQEEAEGCWRRRRVGC